MSLPCPTCHQEMRLTSDMMGQRVQCPHCGSTLEVKARPKPQSQTLPPEQAPFDAAPASAKATADRQGKPLDSAQGEPFESAPVSADDTAGSQDESPFTFTQHEPPDSIPEPPPPPTPVAPPVIDATPASPPPNTTKQSTTSPKISNNPRATRYLIRAVVFVIPLGAAVILLFVLYMIGNALMFRPATNADLIVGLAIMATLGASFLWLTGGYFIAVLIATPLLPNYITAIRCPGCKEVLPTVSDWQCRCGYVEHRQVNILTRHCPGCQKRAGQTNCPYCDATILL